LLKKEGRKVYKGGSTVQASLHRRKALLIIVVSEIGFRLTLLGSKLCNIVKTLAARSVKPCATPCDLVKITIVEDARNSVAITRYTIIKAHSTLDPLE
jgi:hypothetical protein